LGIAMSYSTSFTIGDATISADSPTYFIADIAANHDGDLSRAKDLIWQSKEAGADCAKFQHFQANKIVSDVGFANGVGQVSHQAGWAKPVDQIYDQYHTRRDWTDQLIETCREAEIEFMTTPYDAEAVTMFADIVNAYKVGSGDITFHALIALIARQNKPVILATGAADMADTEAAVEVALAHNSKLCLLQCNTNYTGSLENFRYVNLNVLKTFAERWPGLPLGLSDHTPGHSAVLGAVALGARVIEKHFTDDNARIGPDHAFALNPETWRAMVEATRELEYAMGDGIKRVEGNEEQTIVIQRRALRAARDLPAGTTLTDDDVEALRPCPEGAISPAHASEVLGKTLDRALKRGAEVVWDALR
jgi:sialic acid synthase SpsE